MFALSNSSETNRLLRDAGHDDAAREAIFARHQEQLRRMVRLRLDRRVPGRFTSSVILDEIFREADRRWLVYQARPETSFFLWLRALAGERLQALHQHYLSGRRTGAGP